MDTEKVKTLSDFRASLGAFSDFSQNDDSDEIDDPISAYFKQRCGNASKTYFKKHRESDSDSSIGLIDVDNVSLFGDGEENENLNLRFSENLLDQLNRESLNVKKNKTQSNTSGASASEIDSELDKQRALAQKALKKLNKSEETENDTSIATPKKRESKALADISSKLMNVKLSIGKGSEKYWFQPNFSPNTPRYFNDELSSFGGEDENLMKNDLKEFESAGVSKNRQSQYARRVNSILKEVPEISVSSDMGFESQSKEEQINRFEEDEKNFKLENSALLHNSQISQFSGIDGNDIAQWSAETTNPKAEAGAKNLSIGQFFNMRSNRVSSLVGSVEDVNSIPVSEENSKGSTLTDAQMQELSKSECSLPVSEISHPEKLKIRRCLSTYNLKSVPEVAKSVRYSSVSNASCASDSTVMIQDILAEMESGLSGTQIYEKLMKSYGKKENEEREHKKTEKKSNKKTLESEETPKSSKEPKGKETGRSKKKATRVNESQKGSKNHETPNGDVKLKEVVDSPKNEKIKKIGSNKGFFSSTPKNQGVKNQGEKCKTGCGKVLVSEEADWEAPRAVSIQSIDMNRSEGSEDNDKTVTVNSTASSELNKKNGTIVIDDSFTIEDTIVAGDLTVLSQRIDEMKRDSVCIVRSAEPEEPVLLAVIQKLADLPKGSLDCSALTPLLRDQFPELLSNFPTPNDSSVKVSPRPNLKAQDALVALPGSWVKLPGVWGLTEKICACADLQKTVLVPLLNISQNWLLVSIESLDLVHPQGKKLPGVRKNNEWCVMDFVVVTFKETIIPPDNRQSLKIFFKSKVALKLELMLGFRIKELLNGEVQTRSLRLLINNVHPENYINVLPKDPINFGVIAEQCFDHATVQVSFDGIAELPLTVFIEEDDCISKHFILKPGIGHQTEKEWDNSIYQHLFHEGEKQVLEFRIVFQPNILLKEDSKTQDFKATLVLMLGSKTDTDGVLRKIPIKGSVGYAKFFCSPSCNPLVFRASESGQSVTRSYPLKNVGSLPVTLNVSVINEEPTSDNEDVFVAPKSVYLSKNEEAAINVTFKAPCNENFTKRILRFQVQPNGRVFYETDLIGIVTSTESRPVSRTSGASVSTKSTLNSESVPIKLLTTTLCLSWAALSLEKESKQTFQIKSVSSGTVSIRLSFERNLDAFKLVNDNGERVHKMRKVLKPDCPYVLTVSFRPDVVGPHNNALIFETSHCNRKKKILLNGIGGIPNLLMRNVKSDLNGCKILRLQYSRASNQFENQIEFTNEGRIQAFLLIKTGVKDFSLSHDINISPAAVVIYPDSKVTVKVSQKLKHDDLHQLLSDREIRKIATICVITGDEPSRHRIKRLVQSEILQESERLRLFTGSFHNEKEMQLKNFKDSMGFEMEFLKSLKVHEIAVVIERNNEIYEPSILDETTDEFFSFLSDKTVVTVKSQKPTTATGSCSERQKSTPSDPLDVNTTLFSADMLTSVPSQNRITKWLETLDCA